MSYLDELEPKLEECHNLGFHTADECPTILHTKRVHCQSGAYPSLRCRDWLMGGAGFAGAVAGTWVASNIHMLHHITHAVLRFFGIPCP